MAKARGGPHLLTLDWLGGPIRICTAYGARYKPKLAWALWDDRWSQKKRDAVDLALYAKVSRVTAQG